MSAFPRHTTAVAEPPPPKRAAVTALETSIYSALKDHFTKLSFEVKGEVCGCDLVALSCDDPPFVVICEMKTSINLELLLQAVDRFSAADEVYVAVPASKRGNGRENDRRFQKLCRRLGLGLLSVSGTSVQMLVEPGPYRPRGNPKRRYRVVEEHRRRRGDPTPGGTARTPIMTYYRQQAIRVAAALADRPGRPRDLKRIVPEAQKILSRNVYGWFVRREHGVYGLSHEGQAALQEQARTFED